MDRREFIRVCSAGAGAAAMPAQVMAAAPTLRLHACARLLDAEGDPLRATAVAAQRNCVFFYPYRATPCFLLNLGRALPPAGALLMEYAAASGPYTRPDARGATGTA